MAHDDLLALPPDLPAPEDDGGAAHLSGRAMPSVALPATTGGTIDLARLTGRSVVFAYPRTGRPGEPAGDREAWNMIPGARGCTPQNCAIRDEHARFAERGVAVFGLSAQPTAEQREAAERLRLPYPLLSDEAGELTRVLALPTFEWHGTRLLKRLTLIVADGEIEDVLYPVFPPDRAAADALQRLSEGPSW